MKYDLKRIAGTKPPADLLELARIQNQKSQTSPTTKQRDSEKPSPEAHASSHEKNGTGGSREGDPHT